MLGSMNPLVQRARNGRWWVTVGTYIVSSIAGGALIGLAFASIGHEVRSASGQPDSQVALALLACLGLVGAMVDLGPWRIRLPTMMRQVDEAWRYRYRNWVYATGYGFQLGFGITTIVTTTAVYTTLAATFLVGSWELGALMGAWFGLTRSISVLSVVGVQNSAQFDEIEVRLGRWNRPSRMMTIAGQTILGLALLAAVIA